jgi:hypothetical protein
MWGSRYFSSAYMSLKELAPRAGLEPATFRLTAEVVEILNALSCVAYRETRSIFSPSVGLLGLPAIDSVTPATKLDWELGVETKNKSSYLEVNASLDNSTRESAYFATKQIKSHKCRIWWRLHANVRRNHRLELDGRWTEHGVHKRSRAVARLN